MAHSPCNYRTYTIIFNGIQWGNILKESDEYKYRYAIATGHMRSNLKIMQIDARHSGNTKLVDEIEKILKEVENILQED